MSGESFFVTLPSNSSVSYYPKNTIANFRTKLPQAIDFKIPYEVALTEIQYPKTWNSFTYTDSEISLCNADEVPQGRYSVFITRGQYTSIQQLTEEINRCIASHVVRKLTLTYDSLTNKVIIKANAPYEIMFRGRLAQLLGFAPNIYQMVKSVKQLQPAPFPADLQAGTYNVFVYTDIIEHQSVGDHFAQLLKIVHLDDTRERIVTRSFNHPLYLRVSKSRIDTVEISLKSDQDKPLKFTYGKSIITLHFRPVR